MTNQFMWFVTVAIQIGLIVHVMRTGRPIFWAFVIFFAPMIGALVYFFVELLPELSGNPKARTAMRGIRKSLDPNANLRKLQKQHHLSGSIDAARHLADELIENGRFEEAIDHYQGALKGMYEHDPNLLLGLAEAQFGNDDFAASQATLERLAAENPEFKSSDGHLLYARSLEGCGEMESALQEYEAVSIYYAGAEAKCRFAVLLEQESQPERALELFQDIVESAELAPRHYRRAQHEWIALSKDALKRLDQ